jgi:hypothetical protein
MAMENDNVEVTKPAQDEENEVRVYELHLRNTVRDLIKSGYLHGFTAETSFQDRAESVVHQAAEILDAIKHKLDL